MSSLVHDLRFSWRLLRRIALAGSRLIASRLFGVTPADPITFLFAATLLSVVAVIAALGPANRAARVDHVVALRCE